MGFFSFTKSKVIITVVLVLMALLQAVLPLTVKTANAFLHFLVTLFSWIMIGPVLVRKTLIANGTVTSSSTGGIIVMLLIALIYSYIIACVLAWIGRKISSKEESITTSTPTTTSKTSETSTPRIQVKT